MKEEALAHISKLFETDTEYTEELLESIMDFYLFELNDFEFIGDFITLCLNYFPQNLNFQDGYCEFLTETMQYDKAIELTKQLIDKDPYSFESWYNLARLYATVDQYEKAYEAIEYANTCKDNSSFDKELANLHTFCIYKTKGINQVAEKWGELHNENFSKEKLIIALMSCTYQLCKYKEGYELLCEDIRTRMNELPIFAVIYYFCCCVELSKEEEATALFMRLSNNRNENNIFTQILNLTELIHQDEPVNNILAAIFSSLILAIDKEEETPEELKHLLKEVENYKYETEESTMRKVANSIFNEVGRNN